MKGFLFWDSSYHEKNLLFSQWLETHKKTYSSFEDYDYRKSVFWQNYQIVKSQSQVTATFTLGLNEFADLTDKEFETAYLMKGNPEKEEEHENKIKPSGQNQLRELPRFVDWVKRGAVNPVRDQMHCASCYAFSTISAIESAYFIKYGILKSFSEQVIVDCGREKDPFIKGCDSSRLNSAMNFHREVGVWEASEKPYFGKENKCENIEKPFTKISGYITQIRSVKQLLESVSLGPTTLGLEMNFSIRWYEAGVLDIFAPCGFNLSHNVVVVGYDLDAKIPYIRIKNSWGQTWGNKGFMDIRILEMDSRGMCAWIGVASVRPYF